MTVGTTYDVVETFATGEGHVTRTASAPVPGGCRVSIEGPSLYSYRTIQARRLSAERVAVWPGSGLTVTTSKMLGHLRGALMSAGYVPTGTFEPVTWAVPGRWGGFGPAWHATGYETTPFEVWEDSPEAREADSTRRWHEAQARDAKREAAAARKAARIADQTGAGL